MSTVTESISAEHVEQDPAWSVCPVCGVVVGAADLHAAWHMPPDPAPSTPEEP